MFQWGYDHLHGRSRSSAITPLSLSLWTETVHTLFFYINFKWSITYKCNLKVSYWAEFLMHWLKYTQMEYQINMLVYLVALVTNSLIHQTHRALDWTHCFCNGFRKNYGKMWKVRMYLLGDASGRGRRDFRLCKDAYFYPELCSAARIQWLICMLIRLMCCGTKSMRCMASCSGLRSQFRGYWVHFQPPYWEKTRGRKSQIYAVTQFSVSRWGCSTHRSAGTRRAATMTQGQQTQQGIWNMAQDMSKDL